MVREVGGARDDRDVVHFRRVKLQTLKYPLQCEVLRFNHFRLIMPSHGELLEMDQVGAEELLQQMSLELVVARERALGTMTNYPDALDRSP